MNSAMLSDESISRIDLLYSVARFNDSALSLSDLRVLLKSETTEAELEDAFARSPTLSSKYQLRSGFVFEKGKNATVSRELEKRTLAVRNVVLGARLVQRLRGRGSVVIAISGSTSYESARESDDLDLFCVTQGDNAWIFLTKALLLVRASRLTSSQLSRACLSCVMDQNFAEKAFGSEQDPIFARDALNAIVLAGDEEYRALLLRGKWMRRLFPNLYATRTGSPMTPARRGRPSIKNRVANLLLFHTVGRYIQMKSMLENRRVAKYGDRGRLFETRLGHDHCIYESLRYRQMRKIYSRIESPSLA